MNPIDADRARPRERRSFMPGMMWVLLILVMQGCSTLSGTVDSIPAPEVVAPTLVPLPTPEVSSIAPKPIPAKTPLARVGDASWYGPGFSGKKTASGDVFDETKMTAAHKSLPLGTTAKVTNLKNGKSVKVEINDRGPYAEGRIIDLSQAAAQALGIIDRGVAKVRVETMDNATADEADK